MRYSKERRRAIREGILKARKEHPWTNKGFRWSDEQKKRLSDACLGRNPWNRGLKGDEYKKHFTRIGRPKGARDGYKRSGWEIGSRPNHWTRTPEGRARLSIMKRQPKYLEIARQNIRDAIFPTADTSIEILAQQSLAKEAIPFVTHPNIEGICRPDIQLLDSKTVIFIDGCYFHGCLKDQPPDYLLRGRVPISEIRRRDNWITEVLSAKGWKVVRIWEHEIKHDSDVVAEKMRVLLGPEVMNSQYES